MSEVSPSEFTVILQELGESQGQDPTAVDRLLPVIYDELRRIADSLMRGERLNHTLQPTALVHESYLKLIGSAELQWTDRAHFLALAARAMRRILVDHARHKKAAKREGEWQRVTLVDEAVTTGDRQLEVLELDDALAKLQGQDERAGRVAEMRLFGGMTVKEIAVALDVAPRTVDDDWAVARMWLSREMNGGTAP
jgi:RNA polymerase sigma factor (TIGR02999 family)